MPEAMCEQPQRLEDICLVAYKDYLLDEFNLISQLQKFEKNSVVLKQFEVTADKSLMALEHALTTTVKGIFQDIVRQKLVEMILPELGKWLVVDSNHSQPLFPVLDLLLGDSVEELDFSQNRKWPEEEDKIINLSRKLWLVIRKRCFRLKRLIISRELAFDTPLTGVIGNSGATLTHLTMKRNVPNNMFLQSIGTMCPNLQELDIAGADVVTDFGVICLLMSDPEQVFVECWNREKTVGHTARRGVVSFPQPHFDKPIPDPTDPHAHPNTLNQHVMSKAMGAGPYGQPYLHLKRTFHDVVRDENFDWRVNPVANNLRKLRLENTKIKGDGASVVLELCKNLYSLGYLVFAAAGLKQVYGYEHKAETRLTEVFYRGPSDQKLSTIGNCCPGLRTMFLGSNTLRRMQPNVFRSWKCLEYLTLENIVQEDIATCLVLVGKQLKGLKVQSACLDLTDVIMYCPKLKYLIIQKGSPLKEINVSRLKDEGKSDKDILQHLEYLEISSLSFGLDAYLFLLKSSPNLRSVKAFRVDGLLPEDFKSLKGRLDKLEVFVLFKAAEFQRYGVEAIFDVTPRLRVFGDLRNYDLRPADIKRIKQRVKDEGWMLSLLDSESNVPVSPTSLPPMTDSKDEKDFARYLDLHWFYLTEKQETSETDEQKARATRLKNSLC